MINLEIPQPTYQPTTPQPNECVKFNLHVAEIDKITSLLLGLSARLARTENDIQGLPPATSIAEKVHEASSRTVNSKLRYKSDVSHKHHQCTNVELCSHITEYKFHPLQ